MEKSDKNNIALAKWLGKKCLGGGKKCYLLLCRIGVIAESLLVKEKRCITKFLFSSLHLRFFPYHFVEKYKANQIKVCRDEDGYPYVIHNGKKLFMKKYWAEEQVQRYYVSLLCEQDKESPHKYLSDEERYPNSDSVIADVGAAEGIFSLDIVEDVKKIYMFECDSEWLIPLEKSFTNWKEKIEIVEQYIGNKNDGRTITLDSFFKEKDIDYIKADIEGAEEEMLIGGEYVFTQKVKKALICTYHLPHAGAAIEEYCSKYGFVGKYNPGYILYIYDLKNFRPPFIRHALYYAYKP